METLKKFFETLRTDPKAAELLKGKDKPESFDALIAVYAEVAEKLGFDLPEDVLREGIKALEKEQSEKTGQAKKAARELDESELAKASGGRNDDDCYYSFLDKENCWFQDGCDLTIWTYPHYVCKRIDYDGNKCSSLYIGTF